MRQKRNSQITVCRSIVSSRKEYSKYCCVKSLPYFRENSP